MNKRLLCLIAGLLLTGGGAFALLHWYSEAPYSTRISETDLTRARINSEGATNADLPPAAEAALDLKRPLRLAIGSLGLDEAQNRAMGDLIAVELSGAKEVELVDRQSFDKVLHETELGLSGIVRAKDAIRVGKLLRADWFLLASRHYVTGTNAVVARIVDARTGIMRDVGIFPIKDQLQGARELAGFVRQAREVASGSKPKAYIALGGFVDVGVNDRQADFPKKLRSYLTAAYRGSAKVTMLEREEVDALLEEVHLDLAGLTESSTNPPPPMQFAYWLVETYFQSQESSGYEVELVLRVKRIFGRTYSVTLRGRPDETLYRQIKEKIEAALVQQRVEERSPTRSREIREQYGLGRDILKATTGQNLNNQWEFDFGRIGMSTYEQRGRNINEAIKAFKTVLLLDPVHRPAKFGLATCYFDESINRYDEGRSLLRELSGSSEKDEWSKRALVMLGNSYYSRDDETESWKLIEEAKKQGANVSQHPNLNLDREKAGSEKMEWARKQLFDEAGALNAELRRTSKERVSFYCLSNMRHGYRRGADGARAAAVAVNNYLPELTNKYPDLTPYLVAEAVSLQTDTNSPIVAEFRATFNSYIDHPEKLINLATYIHILEVDDFEWFVRRGLNSVGIELLEAKYRIAAQNPEIEFDQSDQVALAFLYRLAGRWSEALALFEAAGEAPVQMNLSGPWAEVFQPSKAAAKCRQKLGLPVVPKPGRFELGEPCMCLPSTVISASEDGLWMASESKLVHVGFDLRTNLEVSLESSGFPTPTVLCVDSNRVWIGTSESGLIQYDRREKKLHRLTQKDGLLIDSIGALCVDRDRLWIGFANQQSGAVGGLGKLDISSSRITSFTPAFAADPMTANNALGEAAPRKPVWGLTVVGGDCLWVQSGFYEDDFRRFLISKNTWDRNRPHYPGGAVVSSVFKGDDMISLIGFRLFPLRIWDKPTTDGSAAVTNDYFITGPEYEQMKREGKLDGKRSQMAIDSRMPTKTILALSPHGSGEWRCLADVSELPERPVQLVLDGNDLWLGGKYFAAVYDLEQNKIRSFGYLPAERITQMVAAGGYCWIKLDDALFRVSRKDTF